MKKTVCDICGKDAASNERYTVPMNSYYVNEYVMKVLPSEIDLCEECKKNIADVIENLATK